MRLRTQTLLAGAATLVVPLLGWQVVRELDASLLEGRVAAQELASANLRAGLAEALSGDAALAPGARPRAADEPYAVRLDAPLVVDGYDEDWPPGAPSAARGGPRVRAALYRRTLFVVVDVEDPTPAWHRPPAPRPDAGELERSSADERRANGDALELFVQAPDGTRRHALLSPTAPGELPALVGSDATADVAGARAERAGARLARWAAAWRSRPGGWRAELRLPAPPAGSRIGLAAVDAGGRGEGGPGADGSVARAWRGTLSPERMRRLRRDPDAPLPDAVPVLYVPDDALRGLVADAVRPGTRVRLFDAAGRLLVDVDRLNLPGSAPGADPDAPPAPFSSVWDALLFRVFAWLVAGDLPLPLERAPAVLPLHLDVALDTPAGRVANRASRGAERAGAGVPGTHRYVTAERDRVIGTLERFGTRAASGWLLLESNEEHSAAYNGARLARLFSLLVLASAVATLVAVAWSTRLSLRIRALSRDASRAVDRDGRVGAGPLAGAGARDELGELSRDLSALLGRSADYTDHLEALSSTLSHELGTPLAVVRGALENIERGRLDPESATLVERAGRGADQLGALLRSLVESTRIEGALARAERVALDLDAFATDCVTRYAHAYPDVRVTLRRTLEPAPDGGPPARVGRATVAPEALLQALDKLVDNAVDFAADGEVQLVLARLDARAPDERGARRWGRAGRRLGGTAVALGVANRGEPLAPDVATRLFEPMYSARGGDGHLGLGLHVVRLVAELHGGRPTVRERAPWTTIAMVLPIAGREDRDYDAGGERAPVRRTRRTGGA